MTENAKKTTAQSTIQDPPEYNAENAKNPKEGSGWLGGPQNGNEIPGKSTEAAYQQNGQSWLGGPQNGNETPGKSTEGAYQQNGQSFIGGPQDVNQIPGKSTEGDQQKGQSWLGGPQNGNETPNAEQDYTKHRFSETPTKEDKAWTGRGKA